MAPNRAASEVSYLSMKKHFPKWTASNKDEDEFRQPDNNQFRDDQYIDFLLSADWILRPAGLSEFYEEIRKRIKNPEITYEIEVGCFRIRCRRREQQDVVIACNEIMNELVKDVTARGSEAEQLIFLGTSNTDKVRYISEWRAEPPQEAELKSYEVFSYPSKIVAFPFKGTWKIPKTKVEEGLTIRKLFLSHDPAKLMKDTTNCAVVSSTNDLALYLGANSSEEIDEAQHKLENLLRYYDLNSQMGVQKNVIFSEDNSTGIVELRYLAQIDPRYLRNVVLDPTRFQPTSDYKKLFEKGSILRSTRIQQDRLVSAAAQLSPAVPEVVVLEPFIPFSGCNNSNRNHGWETGTTPMSLSRPLALLDDDCLDQVPQAAPGVLEWADSIPSFQGSSLRQDQETLKSRSKISSPEIRANESVVGTNDLIAIDSSPVHSQGSGADARLRMTKDVSEFDTSSRYERSKSSHYQTSSSPNPSQPSRLDANNTTSHVETMSTNSIELENHFISLKEALSTLKPNIVQVDAVNQNRPSEGESSVRLPSEPDSDKNLFGEFYAPEAKQDETHQYEPLDILSTSPQRSAQDIIVLAPTPALMESVRNVTSPGVNSSQIPTSTECKVRSSNSVLTRLERQGLNRRGLDPNTENKIYEHLLEMLEPYRLYQGFVTLRAEIGRFWFTKIHWQHISIPGMKSRPSSIEAMEDSLRSHCVPQDMYFNNILTLFGGDANYISNLPDIDNSAVRMWLPGCTRSFYEFYCMLKNASGRKTYFIVEIDDKSFQHKLRKADPMESNIFVHCAKRDFDFRVAIEATSDIGNKYAPFARELVSSLKVTPQGTGSSLPLLEFANFREWGVDIRNVRYRQVATFDHWGNNTKLHITQLHCMKKKKMAGKQDDMIWHYSAAADSPRPDAGYFTTWFEAYITSDKVDTAFAQNHKLRFAEEASWTPKILEDSGAIDDLLKSATNTVQQMDGVGFYVNNQQDDMRYGRPPLSRQEASMQAEARRPSYSYW